MIYTPAPGTKKSTRSPGRLCHCAFTRGAAASIRGACVSRSLTKGSGTVQQRVWHLPVQTLAMLCQGLHAQLSSGRKPSQWRCDELASPCARPCGPRHAGVQALARPEQGPLDRPRAGGVRAYFASKKVLPSRLISHDPGTSVSVTCATAKRYRHAIWELGKLTRHSSRKAALSCVDTYLRCCNGFARVEGRSARRA